MNMMNCHSVPQQLSLCDCVSVPVSVWCLGLLCHQRDNHHFKQEPSGNNLPPPALLGPSLCGPHKQILWTNRSRYWHRLEIESFDFGWMAQIPPQVLHLCECTISMSANRLYKTLISTQYYVSVWVKEQVESVPTGADDAWNVLWICFCMSPSFSRMGQHINQYDILQLSKIYLEGPSHIGCAQIVFWGRLNYMSSEKEYFGQEHTLYGLIP